MKKVKSGKRGGVSDNEKILAEKQEKKEAAERAVERCTQLMDQYHEEDARWQTAYPDAWEDLQEVEAIKDKCLSAIGQAKPVVAAFGESIGPFQVTKKKTSAKYDPVLLAKVLSELAPENLGEVFKALYAAGVVTSVTIDGTAASVFFPRNPEFQEGLEDAFDPGGTPMTPAVTVPKL